MDRHRKAITVGILVLLALVAQAVLAQEAGAVATEEVGGTSLMTALRQGGILMFPLGLLSVATIALGVYGFMLVQEKRMLTPELVDPLDKALRHLNVEEAIQLTQAKPGLLTNILGAGLERIHDGYLDIPAMEKAMEEASVEETSAGLKTISYLSIIAEIAPMVGLLGTVSGMIKAFAKIGKGAMGRPEVLAADIGEALVTTATGLLIGIPAMFLFFYLRSRYTANVTKLGRVLGNLTHHFVAASREPQAEPAAVAPAVAPLETAE